MKQNELIQSLNTTIQDLKNNPEKDISEMIDKIEIKYIFSHPMKNLNKLFRCRSDNGFPKDDITQYSYIHDATLIGQLRYNLSQEQVLYTATNPTTAFIETIPENQENKYCYISKWNASKKEIKAACLYNPQKATTNSNVESYTKTIAPLMSKVQRDITTRLSFLMENNYQNYSFSSGMASKLFNKNEAILTASVKSNYKELNITFNKNAVDNCLEMEFVVRCKLKSKKNKNYLFNVNQFGIVTKNRIIWYTMILNTNSFKYDIAKYNYDSIKNYIINHPFTLDPFMIDSFNQKSIKIKLGTPRRGILSYEYNLKKLE